MENNELFESVDEFGLGETAKEVESAPKKKKPGGKYGNPLGVKIFIVCLLVIPLATFAVFVVYGNLGGLVQAFFTVKTENGISRTEFAGSQNFKDFLNLPVFPGK